MASDYVIVSIICVEVGNDEYIILLKFGGRSVPATQKISTKTKVRTIVDCTSFQISFTTVYKKTKPYAHIRVFSLNHFI